MARFKAKGTIQIGKGRKRRKGRKGRRKSATRAACIVSSGRKKGKLKKGWRFNKRGACVRAKKK